MYSLIRLFHSQVLSPTRGIAIHVIVISCYLFAAPCLQWTL